jgi:hypothetical protein
LILRASGIFKASALSFEKVFSKMKCVLSGLITPDPSNNNINAHFTSWHLSCSVFKDYEKAWFEMVKDNWCFKFGAFMEIETSVFIK